MAVIFGHSLFCIIFCVCVILSLKYSSIKIKASLGQHFISDMEHLVVKMKIIKRIRMSHFRLYENDCK